MLSARLYGASSQPRTNKNIIQRVKVVGQCSKETNVVDSILNRAILSATKYTARLQFSANIFRNRMAKIKTPWMHAYDDTLDTGGKTFVALNFANNVIFYYKIS